MLATEMVERVLMVQERDAAVRVLVSRRAVLRTCEVAGPLNDEDEAVVGAVMTVCAATIGPRL